jgi:hypothetical protein
MKESRPKINNEDIQGHYFMQQLSSVAAGRYNAVRVAITEWMTF